MYLLLNWKINGDVLELPNFNYHFLPNRLQYMRDQVNGPPVPLMLGLPEKDGSHQHIGQAVPLGSCWQYWGDGLAVC